MQDAQSEAGVRGFGHDAHDGLKTDVAQDVLKSKSVQACESHTEAAAEEDRTYYRKRR